MRISTIELMKHTFSILAGVALICAICLLSSCDKDKGAPTDFSNGCTAIDLGLSVKWASCNVGAHHSESPGYYFAWGETKEKEKYDWAAADDYKWGIYDMTDPPLYGLTRYNGKAEGGDGLTVLLPEDDPATVNWGSKWRAPTYEEAVELVEKCKWAWIEEDKGWIVRSPETGNSIFLPVTRLFDGDEKCGGNEFGAYWTSTVRNPGMEAFSIVACRDPVSIAVSPYYRYYGLPVRAVTEY